MFVCFNVSNKKEFDEEIMELTGIDTIKMIDKTTNFINNKKI